MEMKNIRSLHIAGVKFSRISNIKAKLKNPATLYYEPDTNSGGSNTANYNQAYYDLFEAEPFDNKHGSIFYPVIVETPYGNGIGRWVYWIETKNVLEIVGG
ncbi:hypothetical protein [Lactobacillus hominis]|uniref:Uncharacterized protein n=1 Tax=Lactobacillus hominis DSM 23910 = CRBIP 24.179 TaxID=1423758 RepID=I7JUV4_9LACO|nr:hypothetical protein [Lactobacillus hominis]KRM85738.1 hypothetical protein FC41_GL001053 [Lactobacillus hominis DSM 23910 = CRBIP 24.179]MCT3347215.1 hypothetical protein [Lactobacillus hominis]CCI81741.1 Protein of unknown function [Lactobacillus hominis DSM 23910 = CRBIP 24.179]